MITKEEKKMADLGEEMNNLTGVYGGVEFNNGKIYQ